MFDKMDLGNITQILGDVQKKAQELQDESAGKFYEAKSGGGMVHIKANGKSEIIDIDIDDSLLEDKDSLQILLISAINEVLKEIEDDKKKSIMNMMGGMNPFMAKDN